MLSICISTYNYDISELVQTLYNQCIDLNIPFEILAIEDASNHDLSAKNANFLCSFNNTRHIILNENIGRSAIRNFLAKTAIYEKLIFLDCDTQIDNPDFIKNYLTCKNTHVINGGIKYLFSQKSNKKSLRYKFGIKREMLSAKTRQNKNEIFFTTANFFINKSVFNVVQFRELLKKYGHEDSLFGYELKKNNINILQIDNQVIHNGIESNEMFIKKTEQGIVNLILIENFKGIDKEFFTNIKLIKLYRKISDWRLNKFVFFVLKLFAKRMKKHLILSKNPKMFIFDLYKLYFYNFKKNSCEN